MADGALVNFDMFITIAQKPNSLGKLSTGP